MEIHRQVSAKSGVNVRPRINVRSAQHAMIVDDGNNDDGGVIDDIMEIDDFFYVHNAHVEIDPLEFTDDLFYGVAITFSGNLLKIYFESSSICKLIEGHISLSKKYGPRRLVIRDGLTWFTENSLYTYLHTKKTKTSILLLNHIVSNLNNARANALNHIGNPRIRELMQYRIDIANNTLITIQHPTYTSP